MRTDHRLANTPLAGRSTGRTWHLLLAAASVALAIQAVPVSFPSDQRLAVGPQQVRLFPGQRGFVFTMYGTPGDLDQLKQLVSTMQEKHLGNGFDPEPAARASSKPLFDYLATVGWPVVAYPGCADMQIKGGRCVLGPEDQAALGALNRTGIFNSIQLGEWGYYFHDLSPNERWWHDVYGPDFEAMKHLMKPPGLVGYDQRPTGRRECYDILKDYFTSRSHDLLSLGVEISDCLSRRAARGHSRAAWLHAVRALCDPVAPEGSQGNVGAERAI